MSSFSSTSSSSTRRRIPLPLLLLCTMLWCHAAVAQLTSVASSARQTTGSISPSAASSNAGLGASPTLSIIAIPTVTACSDFRVQWALSGEDPASQEITIQVVNIDVIQSIPAGAPTSSSVTRATSSAAAASATSRAISSPSASRAVVIPSVVRRSLVERADINKTITVQAANVGYTWNVNVPQGRYYLFAQVDDGFNTLAQSVVFTVLEGSNTTCLAAASPQSSSSSLTSTTSPTPSASTGAGAADSGSGSQSGGGGISGGAIAGIVIGALAVIAIIAGCLFWRRRRARRAVRYTGGEKPDMGSSSSHSGPYAIPLGSLNTDGSMASDAEKDAQRSFGSSEEHGHHSNILLAGAAGPGHRTPPQEDAGNPFSTTPSTSSDEAYGGYADEGYTSRRASEVPAGVGAIGTAIPRSRSMSHPAEGQTSPLKESPSGGVGRTGSKRRKPVPSLGAEWGGQLRNEDGSRRGSGSVPLVPSGDQEVAPKRSFQIMPDPPMNPEH